MTGKIIKGIAGFYYVHVAGSGIYECKAKGVFRYRNVKPLVGDNVEINVINELEKKGNIVDILERKNSLIRPAVANIDQAMVVFSIKTPDPNLNLLDRFLVMLENEGINPVICFSKVDIIRDRDDEEAKILKETYESAGYSVLFISSKENYGMEQLISLLKGKTTALAGPSGVGKTSILNALIPEANMETGDISRKIERGKHTTRHTQVFNLDDDTYILDTPGFSSVYAWAMEKEELRNYFPEFRKFEGTCRFNGCVHVNEPECKVKEAVKNGTIGKSRYDNYLMMFNEIKNRKKY